MRFPTPHQSLAVLAALTAASSLSAQWVSFTNQTSTRLVAASGLVATDPQEKDYAWGDLDHDGDIDLICVRKEPQTTPGRYPNVLLMNENGVLTDRSATLTTSTVPGSSAFLDATNDRDVVIVDVDGDGWEDVVTATTLSAGLAQYIRVPRVYINRGLDGSGQWLGLLYDDPLRISDSGWGINGEHRFCSVAAGDVDGDGDMDLYFGDYQQGGNRSTDIDDRLLINDGTGYFTDQSTTRMTFQMLESSFGMKVAMVDMNLDGKIDILKDDALNAPQAVSISYNDTATAGIFGSYQLVYGNSPYHFNVNDLNNDNLPDMIVSDDGQDRYLLHTGVSPTTHLATFSPTFAFSYTGGGADDGFGGNNFIADLNNDGFKDAIVADVDVDIAGCSRRCHIFRNLGNLPNVTLQEQIVSGQVVGGITPAQLQGTFDVAVFDINGDGWNDMVIGRCTGTEIWINNPQFSMSFTYAGGRPAYVAPGSIHQLNVTATGMGVTPQAGTGVLHYSINGGAYQTTAMTDAGAGQYTVALPVLANCNDDMRYYVSVNGGALVFSDPANAPTSTFRVAAAQDTEVLHLNTFEGVPSGWSVVNTAVTTGQWEVANPNPTIYLGQVAAPDQDADPGTAVKCWVTQNGAPGGAATVADVDGGPTDLISPPLNFAGRDGLITYKRWFYSNPTDSLEVAVSPNGTTWTTVETVTGSGNNQWIEHQFRVGDFITPTATVRVRFRTSDNPDNSVTEAAIDSFRAEAFVCNTCQEVYPLATVGNASMSMCGGNLSPGTMTTLSVTGMPAFTNGLLVFDLLPAPTSWFGGQLISPAPIVLGPVFADANGSFGAPLPIGGLLPPGWSLYTQTVYTDTAQTLGVGMTNALMVTWN